MIRFVTDKDQTGDKLAAVEELIFSRCPFITRVFVWCVDGIPKQRKTHFNTSEGKLLT